MKPSISFCTTCMGRRHHLAELYLRNIERAASYPSVEFVLLDYGSQDGLAGWARSELAPWFKRGIVRYFRTDEPRGFHMSHAKNAAHLLAKNDVLVNLDADNAFQPGFPEEIAELFAAAPRSIAHFAHSTRGCSGRIAIARSAFIFLGGYDEELSGWGYEDQDLMRRAVLSGLERRSMRSRHALALDHSAEERTRFMAKESLWSQRQRNRARSDANLSAGKSVANVGRAWGAVQIVEAMPGPTERIAQGPIAAAVSATGISRP